MFEVPTDVLAPCITGHLPSLIAFLLSGFDLFQRVASGLGEGPIALFGLVYILSAGIRGGLDIVGLLGAPGADPLDFDLRPGDVAEAADGIRNGQIVELGALEISNHAALHAAVVVVLRQVGIKADAFLALSEGIQQSKVDK
jgi:hypothetical protein